MRAQVVFAVVCSSLACSQVEEKRRAHDDVERAGDDVVARVEGAPITFKELRRMRDNPYTLGQLQLEHGRETPPPKAREQLALRRLIEQRLFLLEAKRRGLTVEEKEVDDAVLALRRRFPDLASFGAWIQEQGANEESIFESIHADLLVERCRAALEAEASISDDDVQRYYREHSAELQAPGDVRLRIIAVADDDEIDAVIAALRAGVPFSEVARARSHGLRAADGGDTGWIAAAALPAPVRSVVAKLKPGQTYGPIRRGDVRLVARLEDRQPPRALTVEEARPEIERRLRQAWLRAWLADRRAGARIDLLLH